MARFKARELDVLVATTVIEVGVDVPNATVMIVQEADRFGLAQLHQLRGRVGRGAEQSYCVLVSRAKEELTETAQRRLDALVASTDGFELAEVDLALRAIPAALAAASPALAFVTADTEAHVAVVELATGAVLRRISTRPGPRSVERVGERALVGHTAVGAVSILRGSAVEHVLDGFEEPRYAAAAADGRHAFVTDSGRVDVATV